MEMEKYKLKIENKFRGSAINVNYSFPRIQNENEQIESHSIPQE